MKNALILGGAALVCITAAGALAAPESLLPPGFERSTPAPAPRPAPAPVQPGAGANSASSAVVQPIPDGESPSTGAPGLPADFPSIAEIEKMSPDQIDELLGLKPKFDIPPGAQHALERVGVIAQSEGGFPAHSLQNQPAALVRAALQAMQKPLVSRWGHILLRRALASRLDAPADMDPVEFAALRAAALNRLGESYAARSLVQDVDSANYNPALIDAAFDSYVATGDIVGMCPVALLKGDVRKDALWQMTRSICASFTGNAHDASRDLMHDLSRGIAPQIDVLLAQRYAGAAAEGSKAVTIEWDNVRELNPWRFALATALGVDVPEKLRKGAGAYYDRVSAVSPALGLAQRAAAADLAGKEGILSSAAMVDLYGQIYADGDITGDVHNRAHDLREAYVSETPAGRISAIKSLWGSNASDYGRAVLTAYAAARIPVSSDLEGDAPGLIASMLTAGLDANAMRWATVVPEGSQGWALLALAQPRRTNAVGSGGLDTYIGSDSSGSQRRSKFLLAGLYGLGRIDARTAAAAATRLNVDFNRVSPWSRTIAKAADVKNPTLVALLAGLGMQGDGWDKMTARQLYFIVHSLDQVGLSSEARMIAAEAVARA